MKSSMKSQGGLKVGPPYSFINDQYAFTQKVQDSKLLNLHNTSSVQMT